MRNFKSIQFIPLLFTVLILLFFYPLLMGKIPIPADTIVGMYHPWRDNVWSGFTSGVPFKNFLITDPVRQQYVWRHLAVDEMKQGDVPLWNPYSFSGTPLLANFQSGTLYPLNILFFVFPFEVAWTMLVVLQPVLGALFLYWFLRYRELGTFPSMVGALTFVFSGFSIAWLEWNTIGHTVLWLPLILLCTEHIVEYFKQKNSKLQVKSKTLYLWTGLFVFSVSASFLAGHLQVFFYCFLVQLAYLLWRLSMKQNKLRVLALFAACYLSFIAITSAQWIPGMRFISESARNVDQGSWQKEGWFIPWQNLVQFVAPDFFGNPATGNYWGVWNYGEFIGYVGIIPLFFALYGIVFARVKKTLFFSTVVLIGFLFALPTFPATLPYRLNIPFLMVSQPTRLLSIVCISLAVLSAFGVDYWSKEKDAKRTVIIFMLMAISFIALWLFVINPSLFTIGITPEFLEISRRNLILPSLTLLVSGLLLFLSIYLGKKNARASRLLNYSIVILLVFDLFRFGWKFTPFSPREWIFPKTHIIDYLKRQPGQWRMMALDRRIFPPNFAAYYHLQDVGGYDPLYLLSYNQFVSSWERDKPDMSPSAFNRIVTPMNFDHPFADLLGVKYVLSFGPLKTEKLRFLMQEGDTFLYENPDAFPRAFFARWLINAKDEKDEASLLYEHKNELHTDVINTEGIDGFFIKGDEASELSILEYEENSVTIDTKTSNTAFLVLTDVYNPMWNVYIDGKKGRMHRVDHIFRGVVVPGGEHTVRFAASLL